MFERVIKRLQKEGKIRSQKVGIVQVESLLRQATLDLKEAKKISSIAERATYLLAYMAMLKAGRALLLYKTIVEITSEILGDKYQNLTAQFEIMRRKRNEMTYEAGALLSMSEGQKAFSDAILLVLELQLNLNDI